MNTPMHTARSRALVGLAVLVLAVAGCGGGQQQDEQAPAGHAADATPQDHPAPASSGSAGATTIAGITFTPPANWRDLGASGMRQAQYRLDPVADDTAPAEVNVFYFGPASGGGVDANLQRWIGQMQLPDGGDPAAAAERSTFTADGMAGHVVALDGTYSAGGMRPMGGDGAPQPGYRLVGVVLEGPEGSVFFKLTGPQATASAMESDLLAMVKGASR